MVPKWFQSGSKVVPKWFQSGSKVIQSDVTLGLPHSTLGLPHSTPDGRMERDVQDCTLHLTLHLEACKPSTWRSVQNYRVCNVDI